MAVNYDRQKRYREKRKQNEELRLADNEKAKVRQKKYRERHQLVKFGADIPRELYDKTIAKLKQYDVTQKEFIENAIVNFLDEE